jgi:uncharacterized protein
MKKIKYYRIIHILAALLLICLVGDAQLFALEVPPLKGRVNDYAGMLSSYTERQLDGILRDLEKTDSTQIVVSVIPSLEGEVLEEFSIKLAEQWKIGQKGLDNGAILLIVKKERDIRIEVGYGLEGTLTDLMAGRIIRNVIVPQFKAGNFDQGILDGVQAMIGVVRGEYKAPDKVPSRRGRRGGARSGFFGLIAIVFVISMLGRLRRFLGVAAGAVILPLVAILFFNFNLIWVLLLIPGGMLAGVILSLIGPQLMFGHGLSRGGSRGGGWAGGFSSGGFGGGGGGFGGGGASGGW